MTATREPALVRGPLPGPIPMAMVDFDLGAVGYEEEEYLLEGSATSYATAGERSPDGRWSAVEDQAAPFVTRVVVRRPADAGRFSGTVAVEWNNVSGGIDASPDWMLLHRHLIRRGDAWIGVSVQKAGIDGGGIVEGLHLKLLDAERYGTLLHPGDPWAYDIFTQAGQAARRTGDGALLGGLAPIQVLAVGESQSAAFLVTYVNAVDPLSRTFDGYLIHGRPASGAALDGFRVSAVGSSAELLNAPGGEQVRADARVPVLVLQSETDVVLLGGGRAGQADGERVRQWELAGAAHADTYILVAATKDGGQLSPEELAELLKPTTEVMVATTETPINAGPQQHYAGQAAYEHLAGWAAGGPPPPVADRLDVTPAGDGLVLDGDGIATGGIRTPWTEVPTAVLSGLGQDGAVFAVLFGRTVPFDRATLDARYPGGVLQYVDAFAAVLDRSIKEGFLLEADRSEILGLARASFPHP